MRMEHWSFNLITVRLMTLWVGNGPTNLGASFLDSNQKGRSQEDSHTLWDWGWRTYLVDRGSVATHGVLKGRFYGSSGD